MTGPSETTSALVVGVGNPDRGDDAVGPLVIEAFRQRPSPGPNRVDTKVLIGDLVDLVLLWLPDQDVVVIDAMVGGGPPGTIGETDGLVDLPQPRGAVSSHGIGIAEAVALARLLNRLPRSLTIIGVEGAAFGHFAPPSPAVVASVPEVVNRLIERLEMFGQEEDL